MLVKDLIIELLDCDMDAELFVSLEPRAPKRKIAEKKDGLTPPIKAVKNDSNVVHLRTWEE